MDTKRLYDLIASITKWGLITNEEIDKIAGLKRSLIDFYAISLNVNYIFDEIEYDDCPDFDYNQIRDNVNNNFPEFGFYNSLLGLGIKHESQIVVGDAVDDLSDIIKDLLQVKWRIENNSINDGLWFLSFIFESHLERHLLDLLNYIKKD